MQAMQKSGEAMRAVPRRVLRWRFRVRPWQPLLLADVAILAMASLVLPTAAGLIFGGTTLIVLTARGCYNPRFTGQLGALFGSIVTSVAVAAIALSWLLSVDDALQVARIAPFVAAGLIVARAIAGAGVRSIRSYTNGAPTIVIGAGDVAARMARNLREHPEYGLAPIGIVDDVAVRDGSGLPMLGRIEELPDIARRFDVEHVVVAFGKANEERMVEVLRTCQDLDATVWLVPRFFELGAASGADELWGVPVTRLQRRALRGSQWRVKRAFDIAVSGAMLLLLSPVMVAVAVAVKLTSRGPLLFRQPRIGQRGRMIDVLKFRTMAVNDDSNETWNVTRDPRVTLAGRFMRPCGLDELPQLLNVLRGDMSLVGPRPERPHFVELFSGQVPGYSHRHRVPVGLTGLSQVNGLRGDTSIDDRATFDNRYIENWSLWTDVVILFRTVTAVIRPPKSVVIDPVDDERPARVAS
jgi:exopolysaccharide biosynthesis polyprenyl glycosylphosphotransferase